MGTIWCFEPFVQPEVHQNNGCNTSLGVNEKTLCQLLFLKVMLFPESEKTIPLNQYHSSQGRLKVRGQTLMKPVIG